MRTDSRDQRLTDFFSGKGQMSIVGHTGHMASSATSQCCHCNKMQPETKTNETRLCANKTLFARTGGGPDLVPRP